MLEPITWTVVEQKLPGGRAPFGRTASAPCRVTILLPSTQ